MINIGTLTSSKAKYINYNINKPTIQELSKQIYIPSPASQITPKNLNRDEDFFQNKGEGDDHCDIPHEFEEGIKEKRESITIRKLKTKTSKKYLDEKHLLHHVIKNRVRVNQTHKKKPYRYNEIQLVQKLDFSADTPTPVHKTSRISGTPMVQRKTRRSRSIISPEKATKLFENSDLDNTNFNKTARVRKHKEIPCHKEFNPEFEKEYPKYIGFYFREYYNSLANKTYTHSMREEIIEPLYTAEINLSNLADEDPNIDQALKSIKKNDHIVANEKFKNSKSFNVAKGEKSKKETKEKENSPVIPQLSEDFIKKNNENVLH